jgi:hypothetical protein
VKKYRVANNMTRVIDADDIVTYVAAFDESQDSPCFACEDADDEKDECTLVQRSMMSAALRPPLRALVGDTNGAVVTHSEKCGNEGRVFLTRDKAIKLLPSSPAHHARRKEVWMKASDANVGPLVTGADMWYRRFQGFAATEDYEGWSCVQTYVMMPLRDEQFVDVLALMRATARAGLFHVDPSFANVMTYAGGGALKFVDWEEGRTFADERFVGPAEFAMIRLCQNKQVPPMPSDVHARFDMRADDIRFTPLDFYDFVVQTRAWTDVTAFRGELTMREKDFRSFCRYMRFEPSMVEQMLSL